MHRSVLLAGSKGRLVFVREGERYQRARRRTRHAGRRLRRRSGDVLGTLPRMRRECLGEEACLYTEAMEESFAQHGIMVETLEGGVHVNSNEWLILLSSQLEQFGGSDTYQGAVRAICGGTSSSPKTKHLGVVDYNATYSDYRVGHLPWQSMFLIEPQG